MRRTKFFAFFIWAFIALSIRVKGQHPLLRCGAELCEKEAVMKASWLALSLRLWR